jgi:hypothetical protein
MWACSNDRDISLESTTYKISSNIPLRLTPYAQQILGDQERGFRRNGSTTDHIFCIRQTCTWEKMGLQRGSASGIYRLQASLRFSYEEGLVEYSHWVLYPCETNKTDRDVSEWSIQLSPGMSTFVWHVSY